MKLKIEYVGQSANPLIRGSQFQTHNHQVCVNNRLINFADLDDSELQILHDIRPSVRPEMQAAIDQRLNRKSPFEAI